MIVIGTETVERYFDAHAGHKGIRAARSQYDVWLAIGQPCAMAPRTSRPRIRGEHSEGGRAVFNIKGNDYRLIATLQYQAGVFVIRFFGTNAEYDRIDAEMV